MDQYAADQILENLAGCRERTNDSRHYSAKSLLWNARHACEFLPCGSSALRGFPVANLVIVNARNSDDEFESQASRRLMAYSSFDRRCMVFRVAKLCRCVAIWFASSVGACVRRCSVSSPSRMHSGREAGVTMTANACSAVGEGGSTSCPKNRLGPYRLVQRLGEGGMGVVHLGLDERGRGVAIKVLRDHVAHDPTARRRLAREVSTLRRVRHPRVAPVIDADVDGPRPYVVTRYVPGDPLDAWVAAHGPLSGVALATLGRGLAEALGAIHDAGVVHRDLKPGNVLVTGGEPVVIDFGIAHVADESRLTHSGLVMGTPGYLSPELLDGDAVDESTDWWAWAATLAFAATGRPPFGSGPVDAVLHRVYRGEADLRGVDPRLQSVLRAALQPRAELRPGQDEILAALDLYARGGDTGSIVGASGAAGSTAAGEATRPVAPPVALDDTQVQPAIRPSMQETIAHAPSGTSMGGGAAGPAGALGAAAVGAAAVGAAGSCAADGGWTQRLARWAGRGATPAARAHAPGSVRAASPSSASVGVSAVGAGTGGGVSADRSAAVTTTHRVAGTRAMPVAPAPQRTDAPERSAPYVGFSPAPFDPAPDGYRPANREAGERRYEPVAARPQPVVPQPPTAPQAGSAPGAWAAPRPPRRHAIQPVLLTFLLALTALAMTRPIVAALVAASWAVLARTVEASALAMYVNAAERGRRRSDALLAVLASPLRAIPALLTTVLVLVPSVLVAAGVSVGAAALLTASSGVSIAADSESTLALGFVAGVLVAWWGIGGAALRRGSRRTMRALSVNRTGAFALASALLLVAAYFAIASQASGMTPDWSPLSSSPFEGLVPVLPAW